MSPPCLATIFEGDNGGATHRGVSATEIRVAIPGRAGTPPSEYTQAINALFEYFNQNFELYGRRLVPVYIAGSVSTATQARAVGAEAAAQDVFGAISAYTEWVDGQQAAVAELARNQIVTIGRNASTWWTDRTLYDEFHPYVWTTNPSSEDIQANMADFSCRALAGHLAQSALDTDLKAKPRRFGIVALGHEVAPNVGVLSQALEACTGVHPAVLSLNGQTWTTQGRTGLEKFKADGVTTVFCVCEGYRQSTPSSTAHAAGYHPEWIITGGYAASGNDEDWVQSQRVGPTIAPPIKFWGGPRLLPLQARPWYATLAPVIASLTSGWVGNVISMGEVFYGPLLALASGIQAAGPQLTPQTFAAALMSIQFPNPGAGQAPYWQPSAGFGPGDHAFYDDYAVSWWSDTASALDIGVSSRPTGSWCFLGQGARYRVGTYPADADRLLFNADVPCR